MTTPSGHSISRQCIVCSSSKSSTFYPGLLKCAECGMVFADMQLSEEELRDLYRKQYFFGDEYSNYVADKKVLQKNFRLRLRPLFDCIKKFMPDKYDTPLLKLDLFEIGSAYGFFLDIAQKHFQSVTGIDISEDGCEYAKNNGMNVTCGEFLTENINDKLDLFCIWDTIEHLSRPDLYIEKAAQLTNPGGMICITTGNIDSSLAKRKKERWRLIHPPTHLYYFSTETLTKLLERHGYEVVHVESCGTYRSLDNVLYNILVLRRNWPRLYKFFKMTYITYLGFYLNLYDIIYVIARKKPTT